MNQFLTYEIYPEFVNVDFPTMTFTWFSTNKSDIGKHQIDIKYSVNGVQIISYNFTLIVKPEYTDNTGPPFFTKSILDRVFYARDVVSLNFPKIRDPDNDFIEAPIITGLDLPFVSGNFPIYILTPLPNDVGVYMISITLKDFHKEII